MKKSILAVLTAFLVLTGCGTFKKITSSEKSDKNRKETTEKTKDSVTTSSEVLPTESSLNYNLSDLNVSGDFEQRVSSGDGTEAVISKKGDKLTVKTKTAGSKNTNTNVKESEKTEIYDSEFVIKETKKLIKRVPLKFWLLIGLVVTIYFRKFISQILVSIFPALGGKRLFALFLGNKK